jgi:hypothetical protein
MGEKLPQDKKKLETRIFNLEYFHLKTKEEIKTV